MINKIIECVPNFSEGRNKEIIDQIADSVRSVKGVMLLNVDSGAAANRTVMTFAGEPLKVVKAAYKAIITASELIDMSKHKGAHPRIGATDVCPIVPVSGVTLDDCVKYAAKLARKVGDAGIPVYCYEASASREERRNLSSCRKGEYEGLRDKFSDPAWKPDYGPSEFNDNIARTGLSVIGARNFLIAVNFNLNSDSVELAKQIAGEVRESGRLVEIGSSSSPNNAMADSPASECGKTTVHLGASNGGKTVRIPGVLKGCKAIGWYIDEYSRAQVSMNITRITETPLHVAFEEVSRRAEAYKAKVTGTELIGMVPQKVLVDAGRYFLREYGSAPYDMSEKAFRAAGLDGARIRRILRAGKNPESKRIFRITARRIRSNEEALMLVAAQAMRLDDLCPFNIPERVIECAAGLNARCVR